MIELVQHADGVILPVRAQPNARKNAVIGEQGGALKIAVTAPPDQGRANKALVEMLCDLLSVKRSQVDFLSGEKSRDKRFLLRDVDREQLERRLAAVSK